MFGFIIPLRSIWSYDAFFVNNRVLYFHTLQTKHQLTSLFFDWSYKKKEKKTSATSHKILSPRLFNRARKKDMGSDSFAYCKLECFRGLAKRLLVSLSFLAYKLSPWLACSFVWLKQSKGKLTTQIEGGHFHKDGCLHEHGWTIQAPLLCNHQLLMIELQPPMVACPGQYSNTQVEAWGTTRE